MKGGTAVYEHKEVFLCVYSMCVCVGGGVRISYLCSFLFALGKC